MYGQTKGLLVEKKCVYTRIKFSSVKKIYMFLVLGIKLENYRIVYGKKEKMDREKNKQTY